MATSAYQKQYKARGKKARAALARADRNVRKRLGRVAAAQQRLSDALARLARLNQVYGTAYPEQTDLSAGFDDYRAGARQLVGAYPAVEGQAGVPVHTRAGRFPPRFFQEHGIARMAGTSHFSEKTAG